MNRLTSSLPQLETAKVANLVEMTSVNPNLIKWASNKKICLPQAANRRLRRPINEPWYNLQLQRALNNPLMITGLILQLNLNKFKVLLRKVMLYKTSSQSSSSNNNNKTDLRLSQSWWTDPLTKSQLQLSPLLSSKSRCSFPSSKSILLPTRTNHLHPPKSSSKSNLPAFLFHKLTELLTPHQWRLI